MPRKRSKSQVLKDLAQDYGYAQDKYNLVIGVEGKLNWRKELKAIEKQAEELEIDLATLKKAAIKYTK